MQTTILGWPGRAVLDNETVDMRSYGADEPHPVSNFEFLGVAVGGNEW